MADIFQQYKQKKIVIIAENKECAPLDGYCWSEIYRDGIPPSDELISSWLKRKDINYGLVTGRPSGVIALDFDYDLDGLHDVIYKLSGGSTVRKVGSKGFTAFFLYNGEVKNRSWIKNNQVVVELKTTGGKTTIPPSIHRATGEPYYFLEENWDGLHVLPDNFFATLDALFGIKPYVPREYDRQWDNSEPSWEDIDYALGEIDPDLPRDEWVEVMMALEAVSGDGVIERAKSWSAQSTKFKERDFHSTWRSFRGAGIKIGTLYHYAKKYGNWKKPRKSTILPKDSKERHILPQPITPLKDPYALEPLPQIPFGILKRAVHFIDSTAYFPQPELSVAASIPAVGVLMGQRYCTETDLRTNHYTIGLGYSGSGKEHARTCWTKIYMRLKKHKLIGGLPASGAGLFSAVDKAEGVKFFMIDEFGRHFKMMNNDKSGNHEKSILSELIEFFSRSSTLHTSKEYANQKDRETRTIFQPCVGMYGSTMPENFYDGITARDGIDGLIARLLIIGSRVPFSESNDDYKAFTVPDDLVEDIAKLVGKELPADPAPQMVMFSTDARKMWKDYAKKCEKERAPHNSSIISRKHEHAAKLSLTCWFGSGHFTIEEEHMEWGIAIAERCAATSLSILRDNVSDSEFEKLCKRVLGLVKKNSPITLRRLDKNMRDVKQPIIIEALEKLANSDEIEYKDKTATYLG